MPTNGNDSIEGGPDNDTIDGLGGNDTIYGRGGYDSLIGGSGDDVLFGDSGNDVLLGGDGNDRLAGGAGRDWMTGGRGADLFQLDFSDIIEVDTIADYSPGEGDRLIINNAFAPSIQTGLDLDGDGQFDDAQVAQGLVVVTLLNFGTDFISGTAANDSVTGHAWNDSIAGLAGDDTINGLAGADSLVGNQGDDSLNGGDGIDTLLGGDGADVLLASAFDAVDGGAGDDVLFITAASNTAAGWYNLSDPASAATALAVYAVNIERWAFNLGSGNDTVVGSVDGDVVSGRSGDDVLTGGSGNDTLLGDVGADVVSGGAGDDVLVGSQSSLTGRRAAAGAGGEPANGYVRDWGWVFGGDGAADSISGGDGNDYIVFDERDSIDGGAGVDRVLANLALMTAPLILDLTASALGSALSAALGKPIADVEIISELYSGSNSDSIRLADYSAMLPAGAINAIVFAGFGADTVLGSNAAEQIFGDENDDVLSGGGGDDTLAGGPGNDRLTGGAGSDVFDFQSWRISLHTLASGVNNDTITDFSVIEDGLALTGNSVTGVAIFDADGDGSVDDTAVSLSSGFFAGRIVILNTQLTQLGAEFAETLTGADSVDTIFGNNGSDRLSGAAGDDALFGGQGSDTLDGGLGADLLNGGAGTLDVVTYQSATGQLLLLLDQGVGGSAEVGIDSYIGVERFLLGSGADIVIGSSGAESVDGGAGDDWMSLGDGNDTLNGGAGGNDILVGGAGNDVFVGEGGDQFYGGDGVDEVSLASMTVGVTIDIANGYTLSGGVFGAINAVERVSLGSGDDLFVSFTGVTQVALGAGNDWIADYSAGNNDGFFGEAGNDALYGLAGDDSLDGGSGIDILVGGTGNDTLIGGDGFDWLQGGTGADVFRYTAVSHSRASTGTDAISDFARGSDRIHLAAIDANTTLAGDQAFTIGALAAGQAGRLQITFEAGGSPTWALVQGDVDGDGVSDFDVLVFGNVAGLTGTDFAL